MAVADWLRSPRSVLTLYLIGAGAALLCLTWLAVRQLGSEELGSSAPAAAARVGVSTTALADALASYVRSIRSGDSPFDRFEQGDATALTDDARAGLQIFRGRATAFSVMPGRS
jgi:cytochrome c peroxidase